MKRRIAFSFLDEIKSLWRQEFVGVEQTAIAFSLNDKFCPVLQSQMVKRFTLEYVYKIVNMCASHDICCRSDLTLTLEAIIYLV